MSLRKSMPNLKRHDHALIGKHVWYNNNIWLVVSAHANGSTASPWLTLKRGAGIEALAKSYEVEELVN